MERNQLSDLSTGVESGRKNLAGALVVKALSRAGISQKAAAISMGLSEGQLSRQINGTEHLSLQRLMLLPVMFWVELLSLLAEHHGLSLQTVDKKRIAIAQLLGAISAVVQTLED